MKYLIGNWKSNFNTNQAKEWIKKVKPKYKNPENIKIVLCPSHTHLNLFKDMFSNITLGCQYISPFPNGAYTGQISADMVKDLVSFCIAGHSERRKYFHESNQEITNQVDQLIFHQITPIIAVDQENWHSQLSLIGTEKVNQSIVMYEPPEAISKQTGPIGTGHAAPIEEVVEKIKKIKDEFTPKATIYGGSIKSHNIIDFIFHPQIDGVLPGSASLNPDEWLKMIQLIDNHEQD